MSIQISNMGFDYIKPLNKERLNEIELYLNFEQDDKNEQETNETYQNHIKFKLSERFNMVNKINNYKYLIKN